MLVYDVLTTVTGAPLPNVTVTVALVAGPAGGFTDATHVVEHRRVQTDDAGRWQLDLPANADLTPADSYYQATARLGPGRLLVVTFAVPTAGAPPLWVRDIAVLPAADVPPLHALPPATFDAAAMTIGVTDATVDAAGVLRLAGDLAGTADAPTVPGLAGKAATVDVDAALAAKADLVAGVVPLTQIPAAAFDLVANVATVDDMLALDVAGKGALVRVADDGTGNPALFLLPAGADPTDEAQWVEVAMDTDGAAAAALAAAETYTDAAVAPLATTAALAGKQDTDPDLTALAGLDSTQAGMPASDGAGWIRKSYAAVKAALAIGTVDVAGLGSAATHAAGDFDAAGAAAGALTAAEAYADTKVSALVNAAPAALDTLKELADALGDDANYAATVTAALAGKLNVVVHGAVAGTARPAGAPQVLWIGTVAPTNAATNDLWWDKTATLIKLWSGAAWQASGTGTYLSLLDANTLPRFARNGNVIENGLFLQDFNAWTENGRGANNHFDVVQSTTAAGSTLPPPGGSTRYGAIQGGSYIECTAAATSSAHNIQSPSIPVDVTKTGFAQVWARSVSGTPTTYVNVACVNAAGAVTNLRLINGVALTTTWTLFTLAIAPASWPAGTVAAYIQISGAFNTIGVTDFADVELFPDQSYCVTTDTAHRGGAHEIHLDSLGQNVWAINFSGTNTVAKIGLDAKLVAEYALTGQDYPHDITDDGTYLWIVDQNNSKLGKYRMSDGTQVALYNVPAPSTASYGVHLFGGYVWVGSGTGANSRLHRFDPTAGTFTSYDIGLNVTANNVSICDDGTYLWVSSQATSSVIKVNPANGAVVAAVTVPFQPYGVGCDGTYVYVGGAGTNGAYGTIPNRRGIVTRINAATATVDSSHKTPYPSATNWKYDKRRFMYAWGDPDVGGVITKPGGLTAASEGALIRWDTVRNVVEHVPGPWGRMKAVEPVGREVWVVSYYSRELLRFAY